MSLRNSLLIMLAAGLLAGVNSASVAVESKEWLTGGHDNSETYYSPLRRIDTSNVARLGYAWSFDLATTNGMEGTPIVVDGVMYASAPWGFAYALDARSGKQLWSFNPKVDVSVARKVCCGIVSRGLAVSRGRVFVAALDGRLFALDAKTGETLWTVDSIVDHDRAYSVTGSPYVADDKVVIGNSGADLDARGYVSAYSAKTGALAWRFFTVPENATGPFESPELAMAARTWSSNSHWEVGLGGTVWDGMAYDPMSGLLYVGVGNPVIYPRHIRGHARGDDNLFTASILAISAKSGRLAWHYQTVPGDQWDYDADAKMVLTDLRIGDRYHHVLMQAPKDGFFYVLDRITGKLLSADPYVPINWASHVDMKSGRPVETGLDDYEEPKLVFPSLAGGHDWQPMAFNPMTGLVYIPTIEAGAVFWTDSEPFVYQKGGVNIHGHFAFPAANAGDFGLQSDAAKSLPPLAVLSKGQPDATIRGFLRAWDPIKRRVVWQVDTSGPWAGQLNAMWNGGGTLSTAGNLVFQGRSDGYLYAYNASSGTELAKVTVGTGIMASPMTYKIGGVQYIALMAGSGRLGKSLPPGTAAYRYGNANRIVVFKLDGRPVPLPDEIHHTDAFPRPPADRFGTPVQVQHGLDLISRNCSHCHTNEGTAGIPDLRRLSPTTFGEFDDIVLRGARAAAGMGNFSGLLSPADTYDIRAALISEAWMAFEATQ